MKPLQTLLKALLPGVLAAVGVTQPPPFETGGADVGGVRYEQRADGLVEITTKPDGSVTERRLTEPEVAELRGRDDLGAISANHMVRGEAYPNPRRLAPGQSGTLKVIALLSGDAVVLSGGKVRLKLDNAPGLTFGAPAIRAAKPGTREGKFQGQPVYDDFVVFDVPLQVDADATNPGQIYLTGKLHLDLHSGKTGAKIGSFVADVGGRVEVGKPLPTPSVAVGARTKGPGGKAARGAKSAKGATAKGGGTTTGGDRGATKPSTGPKGTGGTMTDPDPAGDPAGGRGVAEGAETAAPDAGPDFVIWGVGGGALLVLILLILVRRK